MHEQGDWELVVLFIYVFYVYLHLMMKHLFTLHYKTLIYTLLYNPVFISSSLSYCSIFFYDLYMLQIQRVLAYEGAVKDISLWDPVVKGNQKVRSESVNQGVDDLNQLI